MINNKIRNLNARLVITLGFHLILCEHETTLKNIGLLMILICSPSLSK